MAQRVTTELLDDKTGGPAAETVIFGYEGRMYEIDLNAANIALLDADMKPWVEIARDITWQTARKQKPKRTTASRQRTQDIRDWAIERGLTQTRNGRIPGHIMRQYEAEHPE